MRTIQDRVIIDPIFAEQLSPSGIYLGEGEMTCEGIIIAVGPGRRVNVVLIPMDVKVGQKVLFTKDAGQRTSLDRKKVLIIREQDILAVVEE